MNRYHAYHAHVAQQLYCTAQPGLLDQHHEQAFICSLDTNRNDNKIAPPSTQSTPTTSSAKYATHLSNGKVVQKPQDLGTVAPYAHLPIWLVPV